MGQNLLLVGGGHAHLGVIQQGRRYTDRGHRLIVVSPSFHDYSGMGPGLLSGQYTLTDVRFDIAALTRAVGGQFIEDTVCGVDPQARQVVLASGSTLSYDILSFNTGSSVLPLPMDSKTPSSVFTVKPVAELLRAREAILQHASRKESTRIVVVGGGAAGCEVAGNLQALAQQQELDLDITLVAGQALLNTCSPRTRQLVLAELMHFPLHLLEGCHVESIHQGVALLDDQRELPFDVLIQATGIKPSGPFKDAGLAIGPQGGLSVNASLHTTLFPEIFAAGDCLFFQSGILAKVGVYAVRQSPVLARNLLAALESKPLRLFYPQKRYLLVFNLGLGRAVATGYGLAWRGSSASRLKNYLDNRFVNSFR